MADQRTKALPRFPRGNSGGLRWVLGQGPRGTVGVRQTQTRQRIGDAPCTDLYRECAFPHSQLAGPWRDDDPQQLSVTLVVNNLRG